MLNQCADFPLGINRVGDHRQNNQKNDANDFQQSGENEGCGWVHYSWLSRTKSRDAAKVTLEVSQQDPSTSLGMTVFILLHELADARKSSRPLARREAMAVLRKIFMVMKEGSFFSCSTVIPN